MTLDFAQVLISFLVLLLSLTFHEAAHAWMADRLGDPTARLLGRLSLNPAVHADLLGTVVFPLLAMTTGLPLIGWAKPVPVNTARLRAPRRDFAIVALAGPVSNLVLAVAAAAVFVLLPVPPDGGPAVNIVAAGLWLAVMVNVLLAVFNMIPIPPLDGGNVLLGVLPHGLAASLDRLRPYGFLLIYVLMLSGALGAIMRPVRAFLVSWLL